MERLVDKVVALVACLPALAAAARGTVGAAVVVALLAAVTSASLVEVLRGSVRLVPPLLCCALVCVLPSSAALLGVAACDLCFVASLEGGRARLAPLAALVALALGWCVGAEGPVVLLAVLGAVVGAWLGLRAGVFECRDRDALRTRDELRAAELSLAEKNRELLDEIGRAHV